MLTGENYKEPEGVFPSWLFCNLWKRLFFQFGLQSRHPDSGYGRFVPFIAELAARPLFCLVG